MAERKQVNLNLGQVAITPSMQAVGGTNQAVAPGVLKDNSALRLSRSLAQFSNLLGQASNINMQRGQDEAQSLTAQEINDIIEGKVPAPTGGPTGKLGFQKAFHQIAAKRWFDTTGVQKYAELENKLDVKMDEFIQNSAPIEQVQNYVQSELNTLDQEIGKYFEGNPFGSRVKNLLGSELSSRVSAGALKGYERKQLAYMKSSKLEEHDKRIAKALTSNEGENIIDVLKDIDTVGLKGFNNKEKAAFYQKTLSSGMSLMLEQAELESARGNDISLYEANIEAFEKFKNKDGVPLFSSTTNKITIARTKNAFNNLDKKDIGLKKSDFTPKIKSQYAQLISLLRRYSLSGNKKILAPEGEPMTTAMVQLNKVFNALDFDNTLDQALAFKNTSRENEIRKIAEAENPQLALDDFLTRLPFNNPQLGPIVRAGLEESYDEFITTRDIINRQILEEDIGIPTDKMQSIIEGATKYFIDNPDADVNNYKTALGLDTNVKLSPKVEKAYQEVHKYDELLDNKDIATNLNAEYSLSSSDMELEGLFEGDLNPAILNSQLIKKDAEDHSKLIRANILDKLRRGEIKESDVEKQIKESVQQAKETYLLELKALAIRQSTLDLSDPRRPLKVQIFPEETKKAKIKQTLKSAIAEDIDDTTLYVNPGAAAFLSTEFWGNWGDKNEKLEEYSTLERKFVQKIFNEENARTAGQIEEVIESLRENIKNDYQKARSSENYEEKIQALNLLQDMYGYDTIDFNSMDMLDDMKATGKDWVDIQLVKDQQELINVLTDFTNVYNKLETEGEEKLNTYEENVLNYAVGMGIFSKAQIGDEGTLTYPYLIEFREAQEQFLLLSK